MHLEDVVPSVRVIGIVGDNPVEIEKATFVGSSALQIVYRIADGSLQEGILYRSDEGRLTPCQKHFWSFDGSAKDFKLASEAHRIQLAYLFDPYLATRTAAIQPLPHQITAVYKEMLPKLPLRFVLADDPGAGKTVMAGLLIKEMMARGDLRRCLIVCPGSLCEQWQDELLEKFGLTFTILTNQQFEASAKRNAFEEYDLCIARLDKLARDEDIKSMLKRSSWDLVVCDEAHKMSAQYTGGEVKYTKRYQLGRLLGDTTENLLLMTATPHDGKPADFQLFMALIDQDRFGINHGSLQLESDVSDCMRRLVKEELLTFEGKPLFPERHAYTINYELSPLESSLYESVTRYVSEEFNRADRLDGKRRNSVGFALTSLQRRLASSPEAIYQSLKRRRKRLATQLDQLRQGSHFELSVSYDGSLYPVNQFEDDFDLDDLDDSARENFEDAVIDSASAAATMVELEAEISTLAELEKMAERLRASGQDRKWEELSRLLQDDAHMFNGEGAREKLIIFTEHKDTLSYLAEKIRSVLGDADAVVVIRGGMRRDDRREAQQRFTQDKNVRVLIATDAAGEGINLQRAHLMVNYDLPWNPNRLEQRFGRIHRIGQTEVCHLWNLVAADTREGQVFQRLFSKLNEEREALGGKVFDVLGRVSFGEQSLRDLLVEAVRRGNDPAVRARLNDVVDQAFDQDALRKLIEEYALTDDVLGAPDVLAVKEEMERAEARKLEPHFISAFFISAIKRLGGRAARREHGRYEIKKVPAAVKREGERMGLPSIGDAYERVAFERDAVAIPDAPVAELVVPGSALLDATCAAIAREMSDVLSRGSMLIDESDWGEDPRLLVCLETEIRDGSATRKGVGRTVNRSLEFVELEPNESVRPAGFAPYLDYREPSEKQSVEIRKFIESEDWLQGDIEERVMRFALEHLVPSRLEYVRAIRDSRIDKVSKAVNTRLTAEVRYWDSKAAELKQKESQGKTNVRINSARAASRAEELATRRAKRLAQLAAERELRPLPPRILGRALIIPHGLLAKLMGERVDPNQRSRREAIEAAGMRAVMAIERDLGFEPRDVSRDNAGYDIESSVPGDMANGLRLLEVKARAAGADSVTVSRNEVLCALNKRDGFILALVEVGETKTTTTYIAHPFSTSPDPAMDATTYSIRKLLAQGKVLLQREEAR